MKVSIIIPAYNVEKYINNMLDGIKKQTMRDFEAIIINDGSKDGTQNIIDKYCKEDQRFKSFYQDNAGVSVARNLGLEQAQGEYIVFWDSDDKVPADSLENLCKSMDDAGADLGIGLEQIVRMTETNIPKNISALAAQKQILKYDARIVWGMGLAHKIFRRDLIEKHNLRFAELSLGEDTVFFLNYLGYCSKITGCNSIVYIYYKRFFLDGNESLTQQTNRYYAGYFETYLDALEKAANALFEQCDFASQEQHYYYKELFFQELYRRVLRIAVFDIYRTIWVWNKEQLQSMYKAVSDIKEKLYLREWLIEVNASKDLNLDSESGVRSAEFLVEHPQLSIVLTRKIKKEFLMSMLKGIYTQKSPEFEILIDEKHAEYLSEYISTYPNCRVITGVDLAEIKNNAVKEAKGKYVSFMDEAMYVSENLYVSLMKGMKQNENIISMYVKYIKGTGLKESGYLKDIFDYGLASLAGSVDGFFSNKVFDVDYLKKKNIVFSNNSRKDIFEIYQNHKITKKKSLCMISEYENKLELEKLPFISKVKYKIMKMLV